MAALKFAWVEGGWPGYDSIAHWQKVSRQRPRSAMSWKTLEKSGLEPAAPNRLVDRKHCALSTQPNVDGRWGFGRVDKAQCFDRLGDLVPQVRAWTSPGFFTTWRFSAFVLKLSFYLKFAFCWSSNISTLLFSNLFRLTFFGIHVVMFLQILQSVLKVTYKADQLLLL